MSTTDQPVSDKVFLERALDATIRIGLVIVLAAWCFQIIRPFITPVIWGIIIALAVYPGYLRLASLLKGRRRLAATITTLLLLVVLLIPTVMLADTLVSGVRHLALNMQSETLKVPPPPENIGDWPLIGERLESFWHKASTNLESVLAPLTPQLKAFGAWLLARGAGAGLGILQFVAAIIISGVLLVYAEAGGRTARAIGTRLADEKGTEYIEIAEATVRSVARGILGVALIQSLLAGLGFLVMGIPGAGLWALIALFLSVIQIGVVPVTLPIVIYVFFTASTGAAIAFLVWNLLVSMADNVLKPILLGRGVDVPMLVIVVGAIGGFLTSGIIGLFVGAVILALGYTLFLAWLEGTPRSAQPATKSGLSQAPPRSAKER